MDLVRVLGLDNKNEYVLLHTNYYRANYKKDFDGAIDLIIKDSTNNRKILKTIENPEFDMYTLKPGIPYPYNRMYGHISELDRKTIKYKDLTYEVAKTIDRLPELKDYMKVGDWDSIRRMQADPRLFSTDVDIEDWYKVELFKYFGDNKYNLTKGFLDIEADIGRGRIDLENAKGDAPVNAVTLINFNSKDCYTLLLRDKDNPLVEEFESKVDEFIGYMHNKYDESYDTFNYHIRFFDNELDVIEMTWKIINTLNLDFILIWNMSFDIRYMYNRIVDLGYDPRNIMCHPDFKYQECFFRYDDKSLTFADKKDYFKCSSYSVFMDQGVNYAKVRAQEKVSKIPDFKLDTIAQLELKMGKLDYAGVTLRDLPRVDFWKFVEYNIRDVMSQYGIEKKVKDIELIFAKCYLTHTKFTKAFSDTVYLRNKIAYEAFKNNGYIFGNNINAILNNGKKEKFKGAYVGKDILMDDVGTSVYGYTKSNRLFGLTNDFDYTAHYPMIITTHDISSPSLIGKYKFVNEEPNEVELSDMDRYIRSEALSRDIEDKEYSNLAHIWLGMPSIHNILQMAEERFGNKRSLSISRKELTNES